MRCFWKRGFTLIELLVVMGIIGILAASITLQIPRVRESARAMKCKTNLRNLFQAANAVQVADEKYACFPVAGTFEGTWVSPSDATVYYFGLYGWVGPNGPWPWGSNNRTTSSVGSITPSSFYSSSRTMSLTDPAYLSLTNGALWGYLGGDTSTFLCETHRAAAAKKVSGHVYRSYVMNGYFGYDAADHRTRHSLDSGTTGAVAADRLMFAELPCRDPWLKTDTTGADSVLEPDDNEYIGFNHLVGRKYGAHVVFADGHVEVLLEPSDSANAAPSDGDLKTLTEELCDAENIDKDILKKMK